MSAAEAISKRKAVISFQPLKSVWQLGLLGTCEAFVVLFCTEGYFISSICKINDSYSLFHLYIYINEGKHNAFWYLFSLLSSSFF